MSAGRGRRTPDGAQQHREWLSLVDVSGPFLSLPVLRDTWPTLDALDKPTREQLRREHGTWQDDPRANQHAWIDYVLEELLGWDDALRRNTDNELDALTLEVPEHDTKLVPVFALVEPNEDAKPGTTRLLGWICPPGSLPTARIKGEDWAATPVDRIARLSRHHEVELGLVTNGRWWTLVRAPRNKVTTTATFDAAAWPEAAERDVVRAFVSLLNRRRFFGVPEDETLPKLLQKSEDSQEEITEALGVQVRQAVELLVAAIGAADTAQREKGEKGLQDVPAHEVYRAAVSVMMRIVFLLFAEERKLLPSDNDLYASSYSVGRLAATLEEEALEGSEDDLEHGFRRWHRLIALFRAVHEGIEHPQLRMHAHDGSLFDPDQYAWLPMQINDRTLLHMLRAVQHVEIGTGRSRERRRLSFRELDVEQIGYVYEGLLSYDALRADDIVVSMIGKRGHEDELRLSYLDDLYARSEDVKDFAETLSKDHKDSGIGSPRKIEKQLVPLDGTDLQEARKKLLAVTRGESELAERLLPFYGIIRRDLRDLPVVILLGELYVTESALRKNTGTHYTPRHLAEQIVEGALEPLAFSPGPLQTANRDEWRLKSSDEILALKVADIAMGSAAFLVAAARYLGDKLIEAATREKADWVRQSTSTDELRSDDEDPVVIQARRLVIEHCLYGVDINPMATEMAKLSLWLISMDPERPFTFLDDRLATGDSLLGIASLDQLRYMHMDPKKGRAIHENALDDTTTGIRDLLAEVAEDRRQIAEIDGSTLEGVKKKQSLLYEAGLKADQARLFADLAAAAALHYVGQGERGLRNGSVHAAELAQRIDKAEPEAREQVRAWLKTDLPPGAFTRQPIHWPLVFPEVFGKGGFDVIIGNPPFLGGQKLTGALGTAYREYLVAVIGRGIRGSADLIAYFALRAHDLLNERGQTGLIATNTLAQGDTREVGLDQLTRDGIAIRQSVKSEPWPSKFVALEYCAIWTSLEKLGDTATYIADGATVRSITSSLDPPSRVAGGPRHVAANSNMSFIGSYVLGMGFMIDPDAAAALIEKDPRNKDVLFPYLNGQDLNSRPDCSASRWVINFRDWTEERARQYPDVFATIEELVRPERQRRKPDGTYTLRNPLPERYWQYAEKRPAMLRAIAGLERVVAVTRISKIAMPVMVPTGQVINEAVVVFATGDPAMMALLSSSPHYLWAISRGSTFETRVIYAPTDVFETFPLPELTDELKELGDRLGKFRRDVMLSRDSGLTKTYNLVFDPSCTDDDIEEMRHIHHAIDEATIRAYGWEDRIEKVGGLDHGFHKVGKEIRYTIGPVAQREVLDSLLELNHECYAEEVAQGLHDKKGGKRTGKSGAEDALF